MRMGLALLGAVVALRKPPVVGLQARGRARCAVLLCALALTGCAPAYSDYHDLSDGSISRPRRQAAKKTVPLPSQALLASPGKPNCKGAGQQLASADPSAAVVPPKPESNPELALRIKLEYERECYRQAEPGPRAAPQAAGIRERNRQGRQAARARPALRCDRGRRAVG